MFNINKRVSQGEKREKYGPSDKYWLAAQLCQSNLSPTAKVIGVVLLEYVNSHSGRAWPSLKTLACTSKIGLRTVYRAVEELTGSGWFTQEKGRTSALSVDRTANASHSYLPVWTKAGNSPWSDGANLANEHENLAGSKGAKIAKEHADLAPNTTEDPSEFSYTSENIPPFSRSPQKEQSIKQPKPEPALAAHFVVGRIHIPAETFQSWEESYKDVVGLNVRPFIESKAEHVRTKYPHDQKDYEAGRVRYLGNLLARRFTELSDQAADRFATAKAQAAVPATRPRSSRI